MPRYRRPWKFEELERDALSIPSVPKTGTVARARPLGVARATELSPTRERYIPRWKLDEGPEGKGPKAASIAAALARFSEQDFVNPQARADYRKLRAAQEAIRESERSSQKVKAAASDMRQYNPTGKDFALNRSGTVARLAARLQGLYFPHFKHLSTVLPCIERAVRREVLFAKGKGGKGYKKPKRRTWSSGVPC